MKIACMVFGLLAALCGPLARVAAAGIPSPGTSFIAARVVVCPAGDSAMVVIARYASFIPWFEGLIVLDFCGCPGVQIIQEDAGCAALEPGSCWLSMTPDPSGVVQVPVAGGGACPGGTVKVFAGGVPLGTRGEPACFDQDANLVVDGADVAIVTSKLGSPDPGADFDGDGTITQADLTILQSHVGHQGAGPVPTIPQASTPGAKSPGR